MIDMVDCLEYCHLVDVKSSGRYFTWNNKQEGERRVFSGIDRVLANLEWIDILCEAEITFMPEGNFDQTLALLSIYPDIGKKTPFRFHNMWCTHPP